jgi:hypothetical protein
MGIASLLGSESSRGRVRVIRAERLGLISSRFEYMRYEIQWCQLQRWMSHLLTDYVGGIPLDLHLLALAVNNNLRILIPNYKPRVEHYSEAGHFDAK